MNKLKRTGYKYDAAYIKYVEKGESKAVYITRDIKGISIGFIPSL